MHKHLKETGKPLHKLNLTKCSTQSQLEKALYQLACMQFIFLVSLLICLLKWLLPCSLLDRDAVISMMKNCFLNRNSR